MRFEKIAKLCGMIVGACALTPTAAYATQTENFGIHVLPAPAEVKVDGKADDWDLSAGVFACDDVENGREKFAVWIHAMYDARNLYILAHFADPTPLNNPGQTAGDYGFAGDSLQLRIVTHANTPAERGEHLTAWRGRDGKDVIVDEHGVKLNGGTTKDLKAQGAQQAFTIDADGKGYVQEIALPWKLLTKDGEPIKAGESFTMTAEPNFTVGASGRLSVKDIFKAGVSIDRVFTFMSPPTWGTATLEPAGHLTPPSVRLSDGREFAVKLANGVPTVDWTGLIKARELPGFKPVAFEMPEDGYVSLHLLASDGTVVRQLVNGEFFTKGRHEVKWDGLTTPIWRQPGVPVPSGDYTWEAIWHKGIGLKLRGWASNGGITPWDYPPGKGNWGGDHGVPVSVAMDEKHVFLGWSAAEAGKALLGCDLQGNVQWSNTHGGIAGAALVAVDNGIVYVVRELDAKGLKKVDLYRLEAATGSYSNWVGNDSPDLDIDSPDGIAASTGKVYLSYTNRNQIKVLDGKTGREEKTIAVDQPTGMKAQGEASLLVVSAGSAVASINLATGKNTTIVSGLSHAAGLAVDHDGTIYVGEREPNRQVQVFDKSGKSLASIGRKGGRPSIGPWMADGFGTISDVGIDAEGKLWVLEADGIPKRVSIWDPKTGKLQKEFFGSTHYGASGGAIDPLDPNIMVGEGCEWRLDPNTGKAVCTGVFEQRTAGAAKFCQANGKLYLVTETGMYQGEGTHIFERLGDGNYKLRASIESAGKDKGASTRFWADANDDGLQQPDEITTLPGSLHLMGYISMDVSVGPDLSLYGDWGGRPASDAVHIKVTGFTACGAPRYDIEHPEKIPARGITSSDSKLLLAGNGGGTHYDIFTCYDLATSKALWTYPNTFAGVHGSHDAPPPEVGLIRGCLGVVGAARLPEPIGDVWAINSNVGEWHLLTGKGFYLSRLFQPDPVKVVFPENAIPGASMDNAPPGLGGEDFGGSLTQGIDGKVYIQAGKTGLWNLEVTGLETVKTLPGGKVSLSADDTKLAAVFREQQLQAAVGRKLFAIKHLSPKFTGNVDQDFNGSDSIRYQKQDDTAVHTAAAWDDQNLYLAWEVKDPTPWENGAQDPTEMYLRGDTVDFQFAANPDADAKRDKAALGDFRLSIGNFKGNATAIIYRPIAAEKHPKIFSSGVVKEFLIDSVLEMKDAKINVTRRQGGYVVEAALPLSSLDIHPQPGKTYHGDFGVTHGDPGGQRTRLRTYWNNQHTGIVDDAVFELQLEPKNWGDITFGN